MILLDMDGPCTDFQTPALHICGRGDLTLADITRYDMASVMGISDAEMWEKIDAAGVEFWRDMPQQPWFDQLWNGLRAIDRVVIATQPSWSWQAVAGKKMWLADRFGAGFRDYYFVGGGDNAGKDLLARPTRCLIDDNQHNVASFLAAGGEACLFPAPWNGQQLPDAAAIEKLLSRVRSKL